MGQGVSEWLAGPLGGRDQARSGTGLNMEGEMETSVRPRETEGERERHGGRGPKTERYKLTERGRETHRQIDRMELGSGVE